MAAYFYEPQPTDDPLRWRLPLVPELCAGPVGYEPFLYGGMGLAAGITALERVTDRPVIWAAAQYLSYGPAGQVLDLDVVVPANGRTVAHARVTGRVGGEEILTVNAALGSRADQPILQWVQAPVVHSPGECVPTTVFPPQNPDAKLVDQLEIRVPAESPLLNRNGELAEDGRCPMWLRSTTGIPINAAMLALFADFVPGSIAASMGHVGGGSSLDNTLRVGNLVPTEWVLCDVETHAVANGMGHGDVLMYAETGELLAIGSQSCLLRFFG